MVAAVEEKELRDGLEQADAAIVAEKLDVLQQVVRRVEGGVVYVARHETELRRLVQRHLRGEVAEGERDRLAEVTVGRVAKESRTRVGSGANEHVVPYFFREVRYYTIFSRARAGAKR